MGRARIKLATEGFFRAGTLSRGQLSTRAGTIPWRAPAEGIGSYSRTDRGPWPGLLEGSGCPRSRRPRSRLRESPAGDSSG